MNLPRWADQQLSQDLSELRARGEGQELEFKQEFPKQVSDLAKEIAAFATSNTGIILFGIKDNGDLIGLEGMEDSRARDVLLRRLEGICSGSIKPAVTSRATWAMESGQIVLALTVPKGSEPVYYTQGRPYLRHITTSRPADPHEVVELVRQYLGSRLEPERVEQTEESAFYSELGSILNRVLLWAETPASDRQVNPWLEEWRADFEYAASELRELATRAVAIREGLDASILKVAIALDEVPAFRLYLGCGVQLEDVASRAKELTIALKRETVDAIPLSDASIAQAGTIVRAISRRLSDLAARAEMVVKEGRIEEIQSQIGLMGKQLVELSFYDLSSLEEGISNKLRVVGMAMRLLEIERIYMDGGASMQRVLDKIMQCTREIKALAESIWP